MQWWKIGDWGRGVYLETSGFPCLRKGHLSWDLAEWGGSHLKNFQAEVWSLRQEKILALRATEKRAVGLSDWKEASTRPLVDKVNRWGASFNQPGANKQPMGVSVPGIWCSVLAEYACNPNIWSYGQLYSGPGKCFTYPASIPQNERWYYFSKCCQDLWLYQC